ncbi:alpha/beta hydrolase-fold protein [candidate division CSSED10-310 bacterium]|uniref:Alpha/beta hydrolase-fold protein n=1 Tax=candidate division CSSED10-310 bacterium TaxID=2855610 RepID=A0ABV6YRS7_UNCC1
MDKTHINQNQTISFYFRRGYASQVAVAGTFSQWEQLPMNQIETGLWYVKTDPLPPGEYQYKFVVDQEWINDAANLRIDEETSNSVISIGLDKGHILHGTFYSPVLGQDKAYCIYLPPSYPFEIGRYYPTLYLMGGLFDYELSWVNEGDVVNIIDGLIKNKQVNEMIIMMPDKDNTCLEGGDGSLYTDYLTKDVIKFCESEYRSFPKQQYRAIEGLSLGAGWALRLVVQFPHLFSSVSALSGVFPEDVMEELEQNRDKIKSLGIRFRFFCGNEEEQLISYLSKTQTWLTSLGIYSEFFTDQGIHRWPLWQKGLRYSLIFHNFGFSRA